MKWILTAAAILLNFWSLSAAGQSSRELPSASRQYKVSVSDGRGWREIVAYDVLCSDSPSHHGDIWNDWDNSKALRDTMSFALVEHDFSKPLKVRVTASGNISSAQVRPTVYGIKCRRVGRNTIEFVIPSFEKRKVSVEFDSDRYANLFLIADKPDDDKPSGDDPSVLYFGPGIHEMDKIVLEDNQTLYIDYGAILFSKIEVNGNNCRIAGHGILSGSRQKHWGTIWASGEILVECNKKRSPARTGTVLEDITIIDSPSWTVSVYNTTDVRIDNINIINWILNGDGVDLVCVQNAIVKDCFIRCYDDCITLKVRHNAYPMTDLSDVTVSGCLIWADFARGIVIGPEAGNLSKSGGRIHDCLVEDCIFLEHASIPEKDDIRGAFAIHHVYSPENNTGCAPDMSGITARRLVFDNISATGRAIVIAQDEKAPESNSMEDILLDDIEILDSGACGISVLEINTYHNEMKDIVLDGLLRNGRPLLKAGRLSGKNMDFTSSEKDVHIRGNIDLTVLNDSSAEDK